jgi:hypothetical protein
MTRLEQLKKESDEAWDALQAVEKKMVQPLRERWSKLYQEFEREELREELRKETTEIK